MQFPQALEPYCPDTQEKESRILAQGIDLFSQGSYREFDRFLFNIPLDRQAQFLQQAMALIEQKYPAEMGRLIVRRLGQHPNFIKYVNALPARWTQVLFFTNLPQLRTRVNMSLFDHPKVPRTEIDYNFSLYNQRGDEILRRYATIRLRETHTFDVKELLASAHVDAEYGAFTLETAEEDLHSLRVYAFWHNNNSITTTHEKGALLNRNRMTIYPTIICDHNRETFIALCNRAPRPVKFECQLLNCAQDAHPQIIRIELNTRGSCFIPLSKYFNDLSDFLRGAPGALYVTNDSEGGIYYYFIHNRELGTWQIQHL